MTYTSLIRFCCREPSPVLGPLSCTWTKARSFACFVTMKLYFPLCSRAHSGRHAPTYRIETARNDIHLAYTNFFLCREQSTVPGPHSCARREGRPFACFMTREVAFFLILIGASEISRNERASGRLKKETNVMLQFKIKWLC